MYEKRRKKGRKSGIVRPRTNFGLNDSMFYWNYENQRVRKVEEVS